MRYGKTITTEFFKELKTFLDQIGYDFDYFIVQERPREINLRIKSPIHVGIFRVNVSIDDFLHNKTPRELAHEILHMSMDYFAYNKKGWETKNMYENMYKKTTKETLIADITPNISKVIFNPPATIVFWEGGSKTVVKAQNDEAFDPEKGLAMAIAKKYFGNKGNYFNQIKEWTKDYKIPVLDFMKHDKKLNLLAAEKLDYESTDTTSWDFDITQSTTEVIGELICNDDEDYKHEFGKDAE